MLLHLSRSLDLSPSESDWCLSVGMHVNLEVPIGGAIDFHLPMSLFQHDMGKLH
jgi:hypothetical protein